MLVDPVCDKGEAMKTNKIFFAGCVLAVLCFFGQASVDAAEKIQLKTKKIYLEPQKTVLDKGKFSFLTALTGGYDNNTHLNSTRDADGFGQTFMKASFRSPLSVKSDILVDYEMMNLAYAGERDLDLTRNGIRFGAEHKLTKAFTLSAGYSLDSVAYWHAKNSDPHDDYLENALDFKLRQQLSSKLFHAFSYNVMLRNYLDRYTRTDFAANTDKERADWRNVLGYEIGRYFQKDLLRVNAQYTDNNANDTYLNYYDYNAYKLGGSLTHLFNKTWSGFLSYSWQYRDYRSRTLLDDPSRTQSDKASLATAALFYTMSKSLSFGLNYTYRQNSSNESVDRYSGSLISLSTYYKF